MTTQEQQTETRRTAATERTKHTPGPWQIEWEYDGDNGSPTGAVIWGADHKGRVCDCSPLAEDSPPPCYIGASASDARLIAAAPDLLQACQLAYEAMSRSWGTNHPRVELLRAAIAKATGQ